ncbi:PAAR domain-containing protein [Aquitalea pelogenes]|uniref:PAAR domain-containing protein n=1 Tax=Aquitalea pelogenes TaxID=1293573 RepID=UPI000788C76C|nr:PAAR domain-containing protein [Aquitalea pelogenes]
MRFVIRQGCRITGRGEVVEGMVDGPTLRGIPVSFIGARVRCDVCNSIGVIAMAGTRGSLGQNNIKGKTLALNNDLVLCRCPVHPRLIHDCQEWQVTI